MFVLEITSKMTSMVGEMVQNSQRLHSFTFNAVIVIHEYIYSHSTTNFTLNDVFLIHEYIYSHLRDIFIHIQRVIFVHIHDRNIHSPFSAHRLCASLGPSFRSIISKRNMTDEW